MLNGGTFTEVLIDQILEDLTTPRSVHAGHESVLDPAYIAQIMANTRIYAKTVAGARRAYNLKKQRPVTTRSPHVLNEAQSAAYACLLRFSHLADNFSLVELKAAFRAAALKSHPDRGGNSETFQAVKKSYHILEALVKNEA